MLRNEVSVFDVSRIIATESIHVERMRRGKLFGKSSCICMTLVRVDASRSDGQCSAQRYDCHLHSYTMVI